jgi:Tfp pilus assembly protein PilF
VTEKPVQLDKSRRKRKLFMIALITISPVLAMVSAVLSEPRFSHVMQDSRSQAELVRTVGQVFHESMPGVALSLFEQAHKMNPQEPNYLTDMGLVKWQSQDDLEGAKKDFLASIKIAPSARALNDLGCIYNEQNKLQEAITAFSQALIADKTWAMAWCNRGMCYQKLGKYDQAISDYSEAIKCRYATAYFGRSETYEAMGRADLAARDRAIIKRHGYTETTFCFMPEPAPPDEQ